MSDGKIGLCGKFCQPCIYRSQMHNSCDYILIEGHPRGCPPGEGCSRREIGKKKKIAFTCNPDVQATVPDAPAPRKVRLSEAEQARRMELYRQGLSDYAMADALGVTYGCVSSWRKVNGLAPNPRPQKQKAKPAKPRQPARKVYPDRLELYNQGLHDSEIAARLGTTAKNIQHWRSRRNLPPNPWALAKNGSEARLSPAEDARRMELYNQGLNDFEIGEATGHGHTVIAKWRHKHGLCANIHRRSSARHQLPDDIAKERLELYKQGLNDRQIAEATCATPGAICQWRKKFGLPKNKKV